MQIVEFGAEQAAAITNYGSSGASSVHLADGQGAAHVYCVRFEPGGMIGPHVAGFDQLFLAVEGAGWASGADGVRRPIAAGQGALFRRGELHAKGSDSGMTAIMIQVDALSPAAPPQATMSSG